MRNCNLSLLRLLFFFFFPMLFFMGLVHLVWGVNMGLEISGAIISRDTRFLLELG